MDEDVIYDDTDYKFKVNQAARQVDFEIEKQVAEIVAAARSGKKEKKEDA